MSKSKFSDQGHCILDSDGIVSYGKFVSPLVPVKIAARCPDINHPLDSPPEPLRLLIKDPKVARSYFFKIKFTVSFDESSL